MSKLKEGRARAKRQWRRSEQRAARLSRSTLPSSVRETLASCSETPSEEAVSNLYAALVTYRGPNAAYRESNRYYYAALAKVYEVWRRIETWPQEARRDLLVMLDQANRSAGTSRRAPGGGDLHVLLRFLIHYKSDQKTEQKLRSRDAAALRQVSRLGWSPEHFLSRAKSGAVGLDRLHRDDVKARRLERQPAATVLEAPVAAAREPEQVASDVADEGGDNARIVWRGLSKDALVEAVKGPHDVVLIGRLDPHEKKIILRRAYLTEYITQSPTELRAMAGTMRDAGLIKAKRVGRRLKM
jgi:hypothetical protein